MDVNGNLSIYMNPINPTKIKQHGLIIVSFFFWLTSFHSPYDPYVSLCLSTIKYCLIEEWMWMGIYQLIYMNAMNPTRMKQECFYIIPLVFYLLPLITHEPYNSLISIQLSLIE